jgi:hypothetical protein
MKRDTQAPCRIGRNYHARFDTGNRVVRWSACNAQLCPEKYSGEEHQNPQGTTERRSPIRRLHRRAHSDQVSSQKIWPCNAALERCFASELCKAASNGLPGSPPHKVPELNALWTISMRRKIPSRHSCVRCSTNRQRFVASAASRFPTLLVLRRLGSTLVEFSRSVAILTSRSNLPMNYGLKRGA